MTFVKLIDWEYHMYPFRKLGNENKVIYSTSKIINEIYSMEMTFIHFQAHVCPDQWDYLGWKGWNLSLENMNNAAFIIVHVSIPCNGVKLTV